MVYNLHEKKIIQNHFGMVTDRKVTYSSHKGKQDIPLEHIVSVSYELKPRLVVGLFCLVLGFIVLLSLKALVFYIIGAVLIGSGLLCFRSSPVVIISTGGGNRIPIKGKPSQKQEAEAFARALKKQLF